MSDKEKGSLIVSVSIWVIGTITSIIASAIAGGEDIQQVPLVVSTVSFIGLSMFLAGMLTTIGIILFSFILEGKE